MFRRGIFCVMACLFLIIVLSFNSQAHADAVWEYTLKEDGTCTITKYNGDAIILAIPSTIEEYTVTAIENIGGYSDLVKVTVPDTVTYIGSYAFAYNKKLQYVVIPDTVESVGDNAFYSTSAEVEVICCTGNVTKGWSSSAKARVKSISYTGTATQIADSAFYNCSALTTVSLPEGILSLGANAFSTCSSLKIVYLPDSLESIGTRAFYLCGSLESIRIGTNLKTIGSEAFYKLSNIKDITLPESLVIIESQAFIGCSGLTDLVIPSSVISVGKGAFKSCTGLTTITLSSKLTQINEEVFSGCSELINIKIPEGILSIGSKAFQFCSSLTSITIPSSVTSIADNAFSGCTALSNITLLTNKLSSVTWLKEVTNLQCLCCRETFENLLSSGVRNFETVVIDRFDDALILPASTVIIEHEAFNAVAAEKAMLSSGVNTVGARAFAHCSSLISIMMPDSIKSIADDAFAGCDVILVCESDNEAALWAREHQYLYIIQ